MQINAKITGMFFDRAEVVKAIGKARVTVLGKAGAIVRKEARAGLVYKPYPKRPRLSRAGGPEGQRKRWAQRYEYNRLRKASYSKPGQSPFIRRKGYPNLSAIKYAYDATIDGVVVGPIERRNRTGLAPSPKMHEHGGTTRIVSTSKLADGREVKHTTVARYPKRQIIAPGFERARPRLPQTMARSIGP